MMSLASLVVGLLGVLRMRFLGERARDASKSPRAVAILWLLATQAACAPLDVDGRAAPLARSAILEFLPTFETKITREALRKLLLTLQAARLIELNGRLVRLSRSLLDKLAQIPLTGNGTSAKPSGANAAAPAAAAPGVAPGSGATTQAHGLPSDVALLFQWLESLMGGGDSPRP